MPELDIASQGDMVEAARDNLKEALELFFEVAPPEEIARRLAEGVESTQITAAVAGFLAWQTLSRLLKVET